MYKIYFYVPESHLEAVKCALFQIGAGRLGNYDSCAWQTLGEGQFRALEGSHPAIGEQHKLAQVKEYKVETVCEDHLLDKALKALIDAHPYETPAFGYWRVSASGQSDPQTL